MLLIKQDTQRTLTLKKSNNVVEKLENITEKLEDNNSWLGDKIC